MSLHTLRIESRSLLQVPFRDLFAPVERFAPLQGCLQHPYLRVQVIFRSLVPRISVIDDEIRGQPMLAMQLSVWKAFIQETAKF